ncbi:MAG: hypothetical protein LBR47_02635 [Spirochaetaceae bacterium]|jgi:outer membrane protein assembly factor BamD (BamD/ComL family)|nr:hypothetical protein [Spirochaetaceae bacterium]
MICTRIKVVSAAVLTAVLFFAGCSTVPKEIPEDLSASELTVLAQEQTDKGNNRGAEVYYQTIIDRYEYDASARIAAEFEIAHIKVKQRRWDEASQRLQALIAQYGTDTSMSLPPEYLKLAEIDLAKVPAGG